MPSATSERHGPTGVRKPYDAVEVPKYLVGKQSNSYTVHDIYRILQYHGKPIGKLTCRKKRLLEMLTTLVADKGITREQRITILRLPLDKEVAVRYQEKNSEGDYAPGAYPQGIVPKIDYDRLAEAISKRTPAIDYGRLAAEVSKHQQRINYEKLTALVMPKLQRHNVVGCPD